MAVKGNLTKNSTVQIITVNIHYKNRKSWEKLENAFVQELLSYCSTTIEVFNFGYNYIELWKNNLNFEKLISQKKNIENLSLIVKYINLEQKWTVDVFLVEQQVNP